MIIKKHIDDVVLGGKYFITCPNCDTTIEYNEECKCGYSTFGEQMKKIMQQLKEQDLQFDEDYY